MLFDAGLATKYWGEVIMTACYVQNRVPTRATDKTPYELWNGEKPDLQHIRVFGSKAYAYVPKEKRTKWDSHSTEGVLVGYSETSTGYRILNPSTAKVTTVMLHSTKDQPQIRNLSLFQLFQTLFSHNRLVLLVQMIKVQFQICKIMHKKTNVLILKSILMKWLSQREISQTKKSLL